MIEYDDDTKASTPQMAYDVSNFITYMQRRVGVLNGDRTFVTSCVVLSALLLYPVRYLKTRALYRNLMSSNLPCTLTPSSQGSLLSERRCLL